MVCDEELKDLAGMSKREGRCSLFLIIDGDAHSGIAPNPPFQLTGDPAKLHELRGEHAAQFEQETAFEVHQKDISA